MVKLLSLKHWKHTFQLVFALLKSSEVSFRDKCVFIIPVVLYWICPDVLPFIPIDDIAFTMFVTEWFASSMAKKYNVKRT